MMLRIQYIVILLILAAFMPRAAAQDEQQKKEEAGEKKAALQAIPDSLEEMLARALRSNPDIRVAEADLHHALAKLKQVRLKISQAVIEAYHELKNQEIRLEMAQKAYSDHKVLEDSGRVGREGYQTKFALMQAMSEAEAALTMAGAQLRVLIGLEPSANKIPESLEEMLTKALQSNGDIQLAEADLLRMQARSDQVRLKVTEDVTIAHQVRRAKKNALDQAKRRLQRILQLRDQGMVGPEEEYPVYQALFEAEAELVQIEARIRYLMG